MCSKALPTHFYKGTSYRFWQEWEGHDQGCAFCPWLGFISRWGDGSLPRLYKTSLIAVLKALAGTITMAHVAAFEVIFKSTSVHHFTFAFAQILTPTVHTGFSTATESKAKESLLRLWPWWQTNLNCLIFPLILFNISRLYQFIYECNSNCSFSFGSFQELLQTSPFAKKLQSHN